MTPEEYARLELRCQAIENAITSGASMTPTVEARMWLYVFKPYAQAGIEMLEAWIKEATC